MPWTGTAPNQTFERTDGTRTGSTVWQEADAASVDIVPDDHDTHDQDIGSSLNQVMKRDGGNTATASLPMGGNRLTNVGKATSPNEILTFGQGRDNEHRYFATVGGTANAITLTSVAGLELTAYAEGQVFFFIALLNNTASTTVNIDGIGPQTIKRFDGVSDILQDDIRAGAICEIRYDGTNFQLNSLAANGASADILARTVPAGAEMFWGLDTIPAGWLKCEGQAVNKADYSELNAKYSADGYPYGSTSLTFNLPPAAGRFLRVVDGGAGQDPDAGTRTDRGDGTTGDNVGTIQTDQVGPHGHDVTDPGHSHSYTRVVGGGTISSASPLSFTNQITNNEQTTTDTTGLTVDATTTTETRSRNIYQYLIVLANPQQASAAASGTYGLDHHFSTLTTGDPGNGRLRLNNATPASATEIAISKTDQHGVDVSGWLSTWDGGTIRHMVLGALQNQFTAVISGAPTDNTTYFTWTITSPSATGSFSDGAPLSVSYFDKGADGPSGGPAVVTGTSTTNLTIGLGSKVFTTQADIDWALGQRLRAASDNGALFMEGPITAYTGTSLTLNIDKTGGSGSHADWNLSIAGVPGQDGVGTGDVVGPASATDLAIAKYSGTTGKVIQNSGLTIDASDNLSGVNNVTGNAANFVVGTAGTTGNLSEWNGTGNLVDSSVATSDVARKSQAVSFAGSVSATAVDANLSAGGNRAMMDISGSAARIGAINGGGAAMTSLAWFVNNANVASLTTNELRPVVDGNIKLGSLTIGFGGLCLSNDADINWGNSGAVIRHRSSPSPDEIDVVTGVFKVDGNPVLDDGTEGQGPITGGANVTSKDLGTTASGTRTLDYSGRALQRYINGGAHTLAPDATEGSAIVLITNNASAGAITTTGWDKVTGDPFTTTNGHNFTCYCSTVNTQQVLNVVAMQ